MIIDMKIRFRLIRPNGKQNYTFAKIITEKNRFHIDFDPNTNSYTCYIVEIMYMGNANFSDTLNVTIECSHYSEMIEPLQNMFPEYFI